MPPLDSPLDQILGEIVVASSTLPLLAVAMTVALPDICVSLESEDGRSDGVRYRRWCADNLPESKFSYVSPDDLWSMRCGVLHNGRFGDMKHEVKRVIFTLPNSSVSFTNCLVGDAYLTDAASFCQAFTEAVRQWSEANRAHPIVKANLPRLFQYRDELPPYIRGVRMIA